MSDNYSAISPGATIEGNGFVYFMDNGGFYVYNGAVQTLPCTVLDYVFSDINLGQAYKIFAASNAEFSEVIWFYPSSSSEEIDRYVSYNYKENLWAIGTMERTAWLDSSIKDYPIGAGKSNGSGYLYQHEFGYDADGSAMTAYIESGSLELDPGQKFMFMSRVIPDFKFKGTTSSNMISLIVKGKDYPLQNLIVKSTSTVGSSTDQVFVRNRMRQAAVRIESTGLGYGWRLGDLRFDLRSDGQR